MKEEIKIIISGGGTGGHVFPAIAIAKELEKTTNCQILFVGADNRMEMQKVPQAGYKIIGLPVIGLPRKLSFKILEALCKFLKSLRISKKIIKDFRPDVAIGVGGYASAALLRVASRRGIPTLIQEQNSLPGLTNRMLSKKASAICVAYEGLEQYFPSSKIRLTGNPVRDLRTNDISRTEALSHFGLSEGKTVLVTGGSLGAKTMNESIIEAIDAIISADIQLIWQTGKRHYAQAKAYYDKFPRQKNIVITEFIDRMDLAYKAADLVVARAGAITISELALLSKAAIFVPSPNVAEDHQTKNAQSLAKKNAAILIKDSEAREKLAKTFIEIVQNEDKINELSKNITNFAQPEATKSIVEIALSLTENKK